MSANPQEIAQQAATDRSGARLAKAQLTFHTNLMKSDAARDYLRKQQISRGGADENGEWYELKASAADSEDRAGDLVKADGYIHTVYDMVDYYYGFVPQAMGDGKTGGLAKDNAVMSTTPGVENVVYGSEVYSLLNSESNLFSLLEKRPWRKSGERYVESRGRNLGEGGVVENAELPETQHPNWDTFEQDPKNVAHTFDVSQIEQLLASTDDDHFSDDPFDWLRRWYGQGTEHQTGQGEHPKMINAQLASSAERDESAGATFENTPQPLDRAISNDAEADEMADATDADIYGFDRAAGDFASNVIQHPSGNRNFTMNVLDDMMREVREESGKDPQTDSNYFWLTGHDTYQKIENEVGAQQRLEPVRVTTGMNGVQTQPGDDVGITVKSYKETPVFKSNDIVKDGTSRIYLVDSATTFIKQLLPTQFFSSGIDVGNDPFAINRLGNEGMFLSIQELTMTNPKASAKARDLK